MFWCGIWDKSHSWCSLDDKFHSASPREILLSSKLHHSCDLSQITQQNMLLPIQLVFEKKGQRSKSNWNRNLKLNWDSNLKLNWDPNSKSNWDSNSKSNWDSNLKSNWDSNTKWNWNSNLNICAISVQNKVKGNVWHIYHNESKVTHGQVNRGERVKEYNKAQQDMHADWWG